MKKRFLLKTGIRALQYKALKHKTPLNVMISITDHCNSQCNYCKVHEMDKHDLDTKELKELITRIREAGAQRIGLWGGEPLVRKDIGEIVNHCTQLGLWTTMVSNGYLFPKRHNEIRNIGHVNFSLDGRPENHDRNREIGAAKKTMAAIKCASDHNFSFWTLTVLTKHNLDDIPYLLDLAQRYDHKAFFQVLHHTEIASQAWTDLLPTDSEYRSAIQKLITYKEQGRPIANSLNGLSHLKNWPDYRQPLSTQPIGQPCLAGKLYCNVTTDGKVTPCSLSPSHDAIDIVDNGFAKAFQELQEPDCKSCSASAFTEYNQIYGLHLPTILSWFSILKKQYNH
jgi:MoaA/NifB/PqqE/SkfB family radical SAM enzyme